MQNFSFFTTPSLVCEVGIAAELAELCSHRLVSRVCLITDRGIVAAGLLEPVLADFADKDIELLVYQDVQADPNEQMVLDAYQLARDSEAQLIIGFGGGSAMDVAKVVAVLAHPKCYQSLHGLYGVDQVSGPRLGLIQVPTTAGTGSEMTSVAVITTGETTKSGIVSHVLQADMAILDAELTLGLPPQVTAATGIDAMVHAIEAYTSAIKKNPYSDMLARQALTLLSANILNAVQQPNDLQCRSNMLLGASLAGQAFANAPVAAVHALAYPLGGHFHISHGLSNALVLPHVMNFNLPVAAPLYAELAPFILPDDYALPDSLQHRAECVISYLQELMADSGLPTRLRDCGVDEGSLGMLAKDAMLQQRLLVNNPRPLTEQDALAIYQLAY